MDEDEILSTENEVPAVEEKSMDDTIRETLAEIESRGDEVTEETAESRARDDKGRFAVKQEQVEQPEVIEQPEQAPSVPPELQKLGLKKEEADAIASNPVAMQAFIRRSEEMHRGLEQYRNKAQIGDGFERVIAPYMQTFQAAGVDPLQATQHLFASEAALRYGTPAQKVQMLHKIASDYGIDLNQAQQYQPEQVDPQVHALQSQLQQMQGWITQQNQAREWQERETLNSEIERFKSDPSHAFFEEVRNDMAGLLQAGLAADLNDAYDKAIYANPQIRSRVLAQQQQESDQARKAAMTQQAQAAKQAASVNIVRKPTIPAAKPIGSMEDTIRQTAERLGIM